MQSLNINTMKNILFFIIGLSVVYYFVNKYQQSNRHILADEIEQSTTLLNEEPICVVFYQDVSGSTTQNGVEIVSSGVFAPYFNDVNRNIELSFGIIDSLTAAKLVSLALPKRTFTAAKLKDLRKLSITEKRREKERFLQAEKQYTLDSLNFFNDRNQRIEEFANNIDSSLAKYQNGLSGQTDLITAIDIADKVFSFTTFGANKKYLLLNSDGLDSFNRKPVKLHNNAEVILINAGKKGRTSVDDILTNSMQSSEQAIQYTLSNSLNH
jgi:hypothetical protein